MADLRREFEQPAGSIKRPGNRQDNDTLLKLHAVYKPHQGLLAFPPSSRHIHTTV